MKIENWQNKKWSDAEYTEKNVKLKRVTVVGNLIIFSTKEEIQCDFLYFPWLQSFPFYLPCASLSIQSQQLLWRSKNKLLPFIFARTSLLSPSFKEGNGKMLVLFPLSYELLWYIFQCPLFFFFCQYKSNKQDNGHARYFF